MSSVVAAIAISHRGSLDIRKPASQHSMPVLHCVLMQFELKGNLVRIWSWPAAVRGRETTELHADTACGWEVIVSDCNSNVTRARRPAGLRRNVHDRRELSIVVMRHPQCDLDANHMSYKKLSLLAALSATAFSGWAHQTDNNTMVVTANRFQQPVNTVLAPTTLITREDIDRWQAKSLTDVMRRLPGVDIGKNGGLGQMSSMFIRGTNSSHALILIDGIRLNQSGISSSTDLSQIPLSLVQRIEYIRGARSAIYGSDAIGGVVNAMTSTLANHLRAESNSVV